MVDYPGNHPDSLARTTSQRWRFALPLWCFCITLVSFVLLQSVGKRPTLLSGDAGSYWEISYQFKLGEPQSWYHHLRTYGYPLYLLFVRTVSARLGLADALRVVTTLEFLWHTLLAVLASATFDNLARAHFSDKLRVYGVAVCFTLVQLDLALLGATQDILTYHPTAVLLGICCWSCTAQTRWRGLYGGVALAVAMVVRPFNYTWAGGVLALTLVLGALSYFTRRSDGQSRWRGVVTQAAGRKLALVCATVLLPVLLLVGWQYHLIYQEENHFGIAASSARMMLRQHTVLRLYTLRYDTYFGPGHTVKIKPAVFYTSWRNHFLVAQCSQAGIELDACLKRNKRYYTYALDTVAIKTAGMFQNFEWSTYRIRLENRPGLFFWQGWLLFLLFLYVPLNYLRLFFTRAPIQLHEHVLALGATVYVMLYSIFTVPQTDYIFPVHAPLIAYGLFYLLKRFAANWRREAIVVSCLAATATLLYLYAHLQLLQSLNIFLQGT